MSFRAFTQKGGRCRPALILIYNMKQPVVYQALSNADGSPRFRDVSELIVFVFRNQYRAPEVLNELRRHEWRWADDLDDAVAVTLDERGRVKVHLSVDLSTNEVNRWARMWGSLLAVTLFLPPPSVVVKAADRTIGESRVLTRNSFATTGQFPDARWWKESLPEEFLRDVSAMIGYGDSAIFMILRTKNLSSALRQLRGYGETFLHTLLGQRQDEELKTMLATM